MESDILMTKLNRINSAVSIDTLLENFKSDSGGDRDVNFLKFLIDNSLLLHEEVILKKTITDFRESFFKKKYTKSNSESTRHYLCRALIQEEFKLLGVNTLNWVEAGNINILRSNSNYDIAAEDLSFIADVGSTPARNFFRGLTDLRVKLYLVTNYFDDYIDDIIFEVFKRGDDNRFIDAVRDYEEGYKLYTPISEENMINL